MLPGAWEMYRGQSQATVAPAQFSINESAGGMAVKSLDFRASSLSSNTSSSYLNWGNLSKASISTCPLAQHTVVTEFIYMKHLEHCLAQFQDSEDALYIEAKCRAGWMHLSARGCLVCFSKPSSHGSQNLLELY